MKQLFMCLSKWWNNQWELSIMTQDEMNDFIDGLFHKYELNKP